ncbi:ankyrin repeat domain-containing protein [Macrococcus capreoli]|uniref:ankyrin repeat domain-containing protein n=1 Tax=Macrococcus capreoli TaxID=2982690 RepID=UPI003EE47B74
MDINSIKEHYRIVKEESLNVFASLIKREPKILHNVFMDETIIYYAISCNRLDIIEYVISNQLIDINDKPQNNDDNLLTKAIRTKNKEIAAFLIKNNIEIDKKNIRLVFYYQFDFEFIEFMMSHTLKEYMHYYQEYAEELKRTDVLNKMTHSYMNESESTVFQSSEMILNFLKTSNESLLELPNGNFKCSTIINRDVHIKGSGNTTLKASKQEGIFQIDGQTLILEDLILETKQGFLIPLFNGRLVLKNCKIIIDEIGIVSENSTIQMIDCEMMRPYQTNNVYSVMSINTTDLYIINSNIEVNLAVAKVDMNSKIYVEDSKIRGDLDYPIFYSTERMDITINNSKLYHAKVAIQAKSNSKVHVKNSEFEIFDKTIYCENNVEVNIYKSKFRKANSHLQIGRKSKILVEECMFSHTDENHITIDQKSVIHVKRCSFDNANMAAVSGLKGSEINVEDSKIRTTIAGIVTQGGKMNIERTQFKEIDEEGAIRGVKNDMISLKDIVIDSSLTDIIVDKPRKLVQENVAITNPVTIDDLI